MPNDRTETQLEPSERNYERLLGYTMDLGYRLRCPEADKLPPGAQERYRKNQERLRVMRLQLWPEDRDVPEGTKLYSAAIGADGRGAVIEAEVMGQERTTLYLDHPHHPGEPYIGELGHGWFATPAEAVAALKERYARALEKAQQKYDAVLVLEDADA